MADPADAKTYAQPRAEAAGLHWPTLQQVLPVATGDDVVDEANRDAVLIGKNTVQLSTSRPRPNSVHLLSGQLRAGMPLTRRCAPLRRLVGVVLGDRSVPEVCRLVAGRVVAAGAVVADDAPLRNGPIIRQLPRDDVNATVSPAPPNLAVPLRSQAPGPDQAFTLTNAFGPELLYGKLRTHCDLPFSRNRGARPRLLTQVRGRFVALILPDRRW